MRFYDDYSCKCVIFQFRFDKKLLLHRKLLKKETFKVFV